MTVYRITKLLGDASEALTTAASEPHLTRLSVGETCLVADNIKPVIDGLTDLTSQLTHRVAAEHQLRLRRLNQPDPVVADELKAAVEAIEDATRSLRSVHACVEDFVDALASTATFTLGKKC